MLAIENRKTKASIFYFIPSDTISFERTYSYSWWSLMIPPKCRCDYQIYYWKSNIVIAKWLLCIWWTKVDRIIRSMAPPSRTRDVWYQGKALPLQLKCTCMCVTDKVVNVENFTNLDESGDPKSGSGISYKWKMLFTTEMFSYFCFIVKKILNNKWFFTRIISTIFV